MANMQQAGDALKAVGEGVQATNEAQAGAAENVVPIGAGGEG